ncbi:MAG: peptidoglycan-binding domain-containing protein [Pseudomonadota bacterium]
MKNSKVAFIVLAAASTGLVLNTSHVRAFVPSSHMGGSAITHVNDTSSKLFIFVQATADEKALALAIQLELNRLGCNAGAPDGIWGNGSKRALAKYAVFSGNANVGDQPTDELLTTLRSDNGRLCTLPPGIVANADRSKTAHLEAVKYSYKVWTTLPSNVVTKKTEYGVLRCKVGRNGSPRDCSWQ